MKFVRVIPCLLLKGTGLVKTVRFRDPIYLGDPMNIMKIFNEKQVDEIAVLDIGASPEGRPPNFDLIHRITGEAFMPLAYGGGIRTLDHAARLLSIGVEKIVLNSILHESPLLVSEMATHFGSQSVVVSIDAKRTPSGDCEVLTHGGRMTTSWTPSGLARRAQELGAGEILLTSIDRDGKLGGYDLSLISAVASSVTIPLIACGGARTVEDFRLALTVGNASAVAAGSMFVFHGRHQAVLISYPSRQDIRNLGESIYRKGEAPK